MQSGQSKKSIPRSRINQTHGLIHVHRILMNGTIQAGFRFETSQIPIGDSNGIQKEGKGVKMIHFRLLNQAPFIEFPHTLLFHANEFVAHPLSVWLHFQLRQ
jgi:hypothetical protein